MSENKIQTYLIQLKKVDGVFIEDKQAVSDEFEPFYIGIRKAEKRLLSDEEVIGLPILKNSQHTQEWTKRARSARRLTKYFMDKESGNLLDLGCGNGWFSASLARNNNLKVVGMDVNLIELKQAARVFQKPNLSFLYGDIFQTHFPVKIFNYITLNAVIQYFESLELLIKRLLALLKPGGEIHFIDSPLYDLIELSGAKQRTVEYYRNKGFPEMGKYYFHHSWSEIATYDPEVLYDNKSKSRILRFFEKPDMPFPWIKIVNRNG